MDNRQQRKDKLKDRTKVGQRQMDGQKIVKDRETDRWTKDNKGQRDRKSYKR